MVAVAQSVEHRIVIPVVVGSIPISHPILSMTYNSRLPVFGIRLFGVLIVRVPLIMNLFDYSVVTATGPSLAALVVAFLCAAASENSVFLC